MSSIARRRRRLTRILALISAVTAQAAFTTPLQRNDRPGVIEWPSREFRTIQAAIDALPDGGTFRFAEGVFPITEPLFVRKNIVIEGAGCAELARRPAKARTTHLVGPRPGRVANFAEARGLVNYIGAAADARPGGGMIRNLKLSGFDAGIRGGPAEDAAAAGGVIVEDVCIDSTGRGIAWSIASSLSVKNVLIQNTLWNGVSISLAHTSGFFVNFGGLTVVGAIGACLFFQNAQGVVDGGLFNFCGSSGTIVARNSNLLIADTSIVGSHGPGIAISGGSAFINETFVKQATGMGILLHDMVHGDVEDVRILDSLPFSTGPQAGKFGDGITVVGGAAEGVVWVTDSSIENSARAGLSNFAGRVALGDTTIQCAAFDLEGETLMGETFQFTDLGGQKCGCPTATGTCTAVSVGFEPPAHVMSFP